MSEETLLSAARRLVRFIDIDEASHGGLISRATLPAVETLRIQVQRETLRLERAAAESARLLAEAREAGHV